MEYRLRFSNLLVPTIVLSLGLVISVITSAVVATRAVNRRTDQRAREQQEITIKGVARQRINADRAVWRIDVRGDGETLRTAFAELDAGIQRLQSFLIERGFNESEIRLSAIATREHQKVDDKGRETREIDGYTLERSLTVSTSRVALVADAAGEVTTLLRENIPVRSNRPEFTISDLGPLKVSILGEASTDARTRAQEIAAKAGATVGEVRGAQQGVIQITRPDSTEVRSYGVYDTDTIEKDVSVVVTVTFGLSPD